MATAVKLYRKSFSSRSKAALFLLKQRNAGRNHFSKSEIARRVGMTSQTVHAVQMLNDLDIDFSNSPRGRKAISITKRRNHKRAITKSA